MVVGALAEHAGATILLDDDAAVVRPLDGMVT
jgi:hypothetical protein